MSTVPQTNNQTTDLTAVRANSLRTLLDKSKDQIVAALPKHLTADRMLRIAMTEARKNPALLECDQSSFIGAVIQAAQLGLEPGGALGHCYLIPFNNRKKGRKEVQFIVGYRGMLDLVRRAGIASNVIARAVYSNDEFSYEFGLEEKLIHKPKPFDKDAKLSYVYAVAFMKDGTKVFDVMAAEDVEGIRKRSSSAESGPWVSDYEAMAKKTVIRRLFKYLPASIEMTTAIGLDELADAGESQNNAGVINVTGRDVTSEKSQALEALVNKPVEPPKSMPERVAEIQKKAEAAQAPQTQEKEPGWDDDVPMSWPRDQEEL